MEGARFDCASLPEYECERECGCCDCDGELLMYCGAVSTSDCELISSSSIEADSRSEEVLLTPARAEIATSGTKHLHIVS